MTPCLNAGDVLKIQQDINTVHLSEALLEYAQDLLDYTRTSSQFAVGLSPRAGLALLRASRAWAFLHDRDHGLPEDLQAVLPWVVSHRLRSAENATEFTGDTLMAMFREVPVP
jgi:MoxR-like ATPase